MDINERVAALEVRVANIQTDVTEIKVDQKAQIGMLSQLTARENRRQGALSVVGKIGAYVGSSGALGALFAWLFHK